MAGIPSKEIVCRTIARKLLGKLELLKFGKQQQKGKSVSRAPLPPSSALTENSYILHQAGGAETLFVGKVLTVHEDECLVHFLNGHGKDFKTRLYKPVWIDPNDQKELFTVKRLARYEAFTSYVPLENIIARNVELSAAGKINVAVWQSARRLGAVLGSIRGFQQRRYKWQHWVAVVCELGSSCADLELHTAQSSENITSAYERERQATIAMNQQVLQNLGLSSVELMPATRKRKRNPRAESDRPRSTRTMSLRSRD